MRLASIAIVLAAASGAAGQVSFQAIKDLQTPTDSTWFPVISGDGATAFGTWGAYPGPPGIGLWTGGPGVIHSTAHPEKAWVIRVTGTDLDVLPRYHFRKQDRILEQA